MPDTNTPAPKVARKRAPKVAAPVDPNAALRADIVALAQGTGAMERIAQRLGVGGKTTFRPWVRAKLGHFGTNTGAMLASTTRDGVPALDAIIDRFGAKPPTAPTA